MHIPGKLKGDVALKLIFWKLLSTFQCWEKVQCNTIFYLKFSWCSSEIFDYTSVTWLHSVDFTSFSVFMPQNLNIKTIFLASESISSPLDTVISRWWPQELPTYLITTELFFLVHFIQWTAQQAYQFSYWGSHFKHHSFFILLLLYEIWSHTTFPCAGWPSNQPSHTS